MHFNFFFFPYYSLQLCTPQSSQKERNELKVHTIHQRYFIDFSLTVVIQLDCNCKKQQIFISDIASYEQLNQTNPPSRLDSHIFLCCSLVKVTLDIARKRNKSLKFLELLIRLFFLCLSNFTSHSGLHVEEPQNITKYKLHFDRARDQLSIRTQRDIFCAISKECVSNCTLSFFYQQINVYEIFALQ